MKKYILSMILFLVSAVTASAEEQVAPANAPPLWYTEHVEFMSRAGGVWVTDNATYKSEQEPFEVYVTEWVAGPANGSLSGKLYALKNGQPTVPFWSFAEYWDPKAQTVMVEQFGWGSIGRGELRESNSAQYMLMEQTFDNFDGTSRRVGHKSSKPDENTHKTISYDIDEAGEWQEDRQYVWTRKPQSSSNE